ncbi:YhgE/Pip domain-containing protein [Rothia aerolata]|uniref:Phage infection protein n=1 Tax=Rothia aerolata TaxID=1812262 RepID=A0A917IW41_9MICC|nr:YhgE/Pip domain-containing protein [Rothia aerolata]GGH64863.1 phage infection protein [Rothia aerolata]
MSALRVALSELKRMSAGILPKLVLIAMACIPLLYGGIYLYANWDPYGNVDEVSGALVMQDAGAQNSDGEHVNTGQDVADNLKESADFDWHDVATRDEAVQEVTDGDYDFALVIPQDFSENLQSAGSFKPDENGNTGEIDPRAAGLEVITNDANNYILTNIVSKAGTSVRDTVASEVGNETANTLLASFTDIHNNLQDASDGSAQLADGTVQLNDAIGQVKDGTADLSNGTVTLKDGTGQLVDGSDQLVDGQQQLADGSSQLSDGADTLAGGASDANDGAQQLSAGADTLSTNMATAAGGAADLADGAKTLHDGTVSLKDGTGQLSDGANQLADGTGQLSDGASQLADGTGQLTDGANQLADGTGQLSDGATRLAEGTQELNTKLSESGLNDISSALTQVCTDLSAAENQPGAASSLTDQVTEQLSKDLRANLAPLVADGTLTQAQVDQLAGDLTSQQTKQQLTETNQRALDQISGQLTDLGSSCATDGTSKVATDIDSLTGAVDQINTGAQDLATGASDLNTGAQDLADGVAEANTGAQDLATGASTLDEKMGELAGGADDLDKGATDLESGAAALETGANQLADGTSQLSDGSATLADGAGELADGTSQLSSGSSSLADAAGQLADGEQTALDGQKQLNSGVLKVDDGAGQLKSGASDLDSGVGQVQDGSADLRDGADELNTGLQDGVKQIPSLSEADQNKVADTMSDPVNLDETSLASGSNYGEGMGPFFIVLALWIGALMLVQTMRPSNTRALASQAPSLRIALGSWVPFGVVGFLQTVLLYAVVRFGLGFHFEHPVAVFWFLALVSLSYTAVVCGLVVLLESPGKLLALVILILQLVTAGGMMPVETLPKSIQWMHDFFPMGYALSGVRRLAYGIDLSALQTDITALLLWLLVGLGLSLLGTIKSRTWNLKKLNPEITV